MSDKDGKKDILEELQDQFKDIAFPGLVKSNKEIIDSQKKEIESLQSQLEKATRTLELAGYKDLGGELWKPPRGESCSPLIDKIDLLESQLAQCMALIHREKWPTHTAKRNLELEGEVIKLKADKDKYRAHIRELRICLKDQKALCKDPEEYQEMQRVLDMMPEQSLSAIKAEWAQEIIDRFPFAFEQHECHRADFPYDCEFPNCQPVEKILETYSNLHHHLKSLTPNTSDEQEVAE